MLRRWNKRWKSFSPLHNVEARCPRECAPRVKTPSEVGVGVPCASKQSMMFQTLLVPHDFSTAAAKAFSIAVELTALSSGRVVLLHVSPIPHGLRGEMRLVPENEGAPVRIDDHMIHAARAKLAEIAKDRAPNAHIHAVAAEEDIAEAILKQAHLLAADMIVMGTHGKTGVRRLLLGSVAERVLRGATVPVLVVRDTHADEQHLREEERVRAEEVG